MDSHAGKKVERLYALKTFPKELFDYLYDELDKQENNISEVSAFFINNDFFELAINALDDGCESFHISIVLDKIGVVKDFETKVLILFLKKLHKTNEEYLPLKTGKVFTQISTLFPEKIPSLIESLKNLEYNFVPEAIVTLVNNNPNQSINEKYFHSIEFINSNVKEQYIAGYAILEACISNPAFSEKEDAIKFLFNLLNVKKDYELQRIVKILCNLSLSNLNIQKEIFELRNKNDPYINHAISQFLLSNSRQISKTEYLKELFITFTTIPCEYKGIINNLGYILLELCKIEFDLFFNFITRWIDKSDFRNSGTPFCEIWSSFFHSLDFGAHINYILSSYFLQNDIIYHKVAAEIILETGVISKKHLYFEKEIIKDCTKEDVIFLCRKLLGNIYDIEKLCDLFDSILQIKINDKDIAKIIFDVFLRLGAEYGIPVLECVKEKNNSEDSTVSEFYTELLPLITNICKRNNNRELFPELFASYDQKIAASRKRKEENKEIIKNANSKSVVMNLVKSVSILYGKGFCYKLPDSQKSQSSNFSKIEQSFYLSKKDIFCPVDAELERHFFRRAKRGEK